MTHKITPLRSAGAAIAAVLALSSTTGVAQEITAPVIAPQPAPPPPVFVPQAAPPPAAPAPTIIIPVQPQAPAAKPAIAAAPAEAPQPRAARTPARPAPVASVPRRAVPVAPAAVASPAATDTVEAPVATIAPADVEFAPEQAPLVDEPPVVINDDGLSAGELGLIGGALAIGGLAAAALFARRRRDPDAAPDDYVAATFTPRQPDVPPVATAPVVPLRPASTAPAPAPAPVDRAPINSATVSAFTPAVAAQPARAPVSGPVGHHVRLAEQGPTADNPFKTRRNRMRRARFLDAQDAKSGATNLSGNWLDDNNPRFRAAALR